MDLPDVMTRSERLGPILHRAAVTPDGIPHVDRHHQTLDCVVGRSSVKARNAAARWIVRLHNQVTANPGWDPLMVWGLARLLSSSSHKHHLRSMMSDDLDLFWPGGPDDSPEIISIEIRPNRARLLAGFGFDGRSERRGG